MPWYNPLPLLPPKNPNPEQRTVGSVIHTKRLWWLSWLASFCGSMDHGSNHDLLRIRTKSNCR